MSGSDCPKCDIHHRGSQARIRISVALAIGEVKIEYQVKLEPKEVSRWFEGVPAAASVGIRLGRDGTRTIKLGPLPSTWNRKTARSLLCFWGRLELTKVEPVSESTNGARC